MNDIFLNQWMINGKHSYGMQETRWEQFFTERSIPTEYKKYDENNFLPSEAFLTECKKYDGNNFYRVTHS